MSSAPTAATDEAPTEEARTEILVEAGLFVRDPSVFPGLSLQMDPSEGLDPAFIPKRYDTRHTTGEMVHCSICAQRQEHFDGAIVRLCGGAIGLVGNDCGKRHFFGEDGWTAISNRMQRAEDHAIFLARFGPAKERLEAIDDLLGQWWDRLGETQLQRDRFEAALPHLFMAVRKQAREGVLYLDQPTEVPFRRANGQTGYRTEIRQIALCRVDARWFWERAVLGVEVDRCRSQLRQAATFLHADAKSHNVAAVKKMLRECRRDLEAVAAKQSELKSLRSADTIARLADWGNRATGGKDSYSASGKHVARSRGGIIKADIDLGALPHDLEERWKRIEALWPSL
jgi:hypothetical protein